jgi:hypothetical protein
MIGGQQPCERCRIHGIEPLPVHERVHSPLPVRYGCADGAVALPDEVDTLSDLQPRIGWDRWWMDRRGEACVPRWRVVGEEPPCEREGVVRSDHNPVIVEPVVVRHRSASSWLSEAITGRCASTTPNHTVSPGANAASSASTSARPHEPRQLQSPVRADLSRPKVPLDGDGLARLRHLGDPVTVLERPRGFEWEPVILV